MKTARRHMHRCVHCGRRHYCDPQDWSKAEHLYRCAEVGLWFRHEETA